MTHTVRAGETLTRIAESHRLTLGQLLAANPQFSANPNRIRVGDIVIIPDEQVDPATRDTAGAPAPTPAGPERVLGKLSEQFETGGRGAGTVSSGVGDAGGVSYGSYQMTSKPGGGTVGRFVTQVDFPFRDDFAGLIPGTSEFSTVWKKLAETNPREFQGAQHEYIKRTHFDPLVQKIQRENGLNVLTRSHALQDVIWSTAVQHGPGTGIPGRALHRVDIPPSHPDFDRDLIIAIYAERGRRNAEGVLAHFSRNSPAVQNGVARRFENEQRKALDMLTKEGRGSGEGEHAGSPER